MTKRSSSKPNRRTFALATATATGATMLMRSGALGQEAATPATSPTVSTDTALVSTVIATGLSNPRHLAFDDLLTLYVTESGTGGDEIPPSPEFVGHGTPEVTPETGEPIATRGYTGQITVIVPDGSQAVVLDGLASYSDGVGPTGIVWHDGVVYYTIGGAAVGAGYEPLPEENTVNAFDPGTGKTTLLAELGPFEVDNNPDGADVNPNLYGMAVTVEGQLAVADAGGNAIYTVAPETGTFDLLTVVPNLTDLTGEAPDPTSGPRQPIPMSVAVDTEGVLAVGLLSQFWPVDGPSVLSYLDGTFATLTTGLSMVVGIAFGPDGHLYVSQLSTDLTTFAPGNVLRVLTDGQTEVVIEGVPAPHGIAFDLKGSLYVVVNSLGSAPGVPIGEIHRIDGVAFPRA